ncbi:heavy-metal-associated domain-containing protein [Embleya sp. NBC_00896]|uniref:heavy-metal-associated domain-containing protein n=1 Tax=Embleya sp. NBC_00896 TaxID=2975961 RepID=UPI0038653605|nr:heavy-metal-associated domain-containing protein [Embleya sp. NBC_00896]
MSTSTSVYTVEGMTCGSCASSVTTRVTALPGVTSAVVDLPTGTLTVTATPALSEAAVATAVTTAGYTLTAAPATTKAACCGSCG